MTLPPPFAAIEAIPFAFPGIASVSCVFGCAPAGSMVSEQPSGPAGEAASRRRRFLGNFGLSRWVELKQVHQDDLLVNPAPTSPDLMSDREGDGTCTREKELALVVKSADCQPIMMTNRQGTAVAALHVGWRGNVLNFPASGLKNFCSAFCLRPEDVLAVRGPSLGAGEFINFHKEWPPEFTPWYNENSRTMNLWALTRHQLEQAGMPPENIFSLDLCTYSLPDMFFSYRRGDPGRQVSLIWLKN